MRKYEITFARSARKELQSLSLPLAERILGKIEQLGINPRPHGYKKLRGQPVLFRIKVGSYRVIYSIDDTGLVIDISVVRHRSEAYR
jgi:mRNA interferase RelE/StbE